MNITAFMNLMVILVPFLLITAVFSRLAILELALPGEQAAPRDEQAPGLEITVRRGRIEIADHRAAPRIIENTGQGHDLEMLSRTLRRIKVRYPEERAATLLLEPDIPYDVLVQVMDRVRFAQVVRATTVVNTELFPDIAIGDAGPEARP